MAAHFFYGTLSHHPLLTQILGREIASKPARLAGHSVHWVAGESFPMIVPAGGQYAQGVLVEGLREADVARLDFYEGGFAYRTHLVEVDAGARVPVAAMVYMAEPGLWQPGSAWRLEDWAAIWGDTVCTTAKDFMSHFGRSDVDHALRRYPMMLVRGASRVRAAARSAPTVRRRNASDSDVQVTERREPYGAFFAVEEYDLSFRRFDGSMSAEVNRAVFISGDAATVLPYDPVRDRVLLIEQFRPGPYARGDAQPWLLEPIAGRVDPGESPEAAARREAVEEAGLTLGALIAVGEYYPSPGAKSEFLYSYIGLADLPDEAVGTGGGLASEHEDIRSHLMSFDELMALVSSGEAANAPLLISALALAQRRAELRANAGA